MPATESLIDTSCPDCGSKNTLFKKSTDTIWCRRCGNEFKPKGKGKTKTSPKKATVKKKAKAKKATGKK